MVTVIVHYCKIVLFHSPNPWVSKSSLASKSIITTQIFYFFHNAVYIPNMLSIYQLTFYKASDKFGNRETNLPIIPINLALPIKMPIKLSIIF